MDSKRNFFLNLILIVVALVSAFKLPFEVFIFSYIVLGPLHYFMEINWLNDNKYFVKQQKGMLILVAFAMLASIPTLLKLPVFSALSAQNTVLQIVTIINNYFNEIAVSTLLFTICLVYFKKGYDVLLGLVASLLLGVWILNYITSSILLLVFLTTLIHVYVFTLLFMILETLKTKNSMGWAVNLLLLICPLIIAAGTIDPAAYAVSEWVKNNLLASGLDLIGSNLAIVLGMLKNGQFMVLSKTGIKIQIFITFCFTYHYLNWFFRTSIVGWYKSASKTKIGMIITLWCLSLFLYWYDYRISLAALFFCNIIHVFLEFPFNITSIKEIIEALKNNPKHGAVSNTLSSNKKAGIRKVAKSS